MLSRALGVGDYREPLRFPSVQMNPSLNMDEMFPPQAAEATLTTQSWSRVCIAHQYVRFRSRRSNSRRLMLLSRVVFACWATASNTVVPAKTTSHRYTRTYSIPYVPWYTCIRVVRQLEYGTKHAMRHRQPPAPVASMVGLVGACDCGFAIE